MVFGEPPRPEQARQRTNAQLRPEPPEVQQQESRQEVATMLYRWAQTYSSRDLRRHMTLYAPKLDRFYDRTDVGRASVRSEKQRVLNRHSRNHGPQIRDVSLNEEDGGRIVIAEFGRTGERAGLVRQRLVWKRLRPGEWKIIREELL
jgi:ketosteroid isomerase-like protein